MRIRRSLTRRAWLGGILSSAAPGAQAMHWNPGSWEKHAGNPILAMGREGEFDSQNIFAPSVAKDNGKYVMLYSGGPFGPKNGTDYVKYQLGLAFSNDGRKFTKTGGPILPLGQRDDFHATPALLRNPDGSLHKEGGLWHAVYCGNRLDDVEHATSKDGIRWKKENTGPIYRMAYSPTLIRSGREIRMYYIAKPGIDGKGLRKPWEIHLATGPDLHRLRAHEANPVMVLSQPWERAALFYPYVLQEGRRWIMFYAAYWAQAPAQEKDQFTAIGVAASDDGVRWEKFDGNPIVKPTSGSSYDSRYCSSQAVIWEGDHYKMYYASRINMVHKYYALNLATHKGRLLG